MEAHRERERERDRDWRRIRVRMQKILRLPVPASWRRSRTASVLIHGLGLWSWNQGKSPRGSYLSHGKTGGRNLRTVTLDQGEMYARVRKQSARSVSLSPPIEIVNSRRSFIGRRVIVTIKTFRTFKSVTRAPRVFRVSVTFRYKRHVCRRLLASVRHFSLPASDCQIFRRSLKHLIKRCLVGIALSNIRVYTCLIESYSRVSVSVL